MLIAVIRLSVCHLLRSSAQPIKLKAFLVFFYWCLHILSGLSIFSSNHFSFLLDTYEIVTQKIHPTFFLTTWPLFSYQKLLIVHTTVYYATPHLQCLILRNSYTMGWNYIWHSILVSNFLRFHEILFFYFHSSLIRMNCVNTFSWRLQMVIVLFWE